jgi:hypothetical protein
MRPEPDTGGVSAPGLAGPVRQLGRYLGNFRFEGHHAAPRFEPGQGAAEKIPVRLGVRVKGAVPQGLLKFGPLPDELRVCSSKYASASLCQMYVSATPKGESCRACKTGNRAGRRA